MIDFKRFRYAAPPRTGTTWFAHVIYEVFGETSCKAGVHQPMPQELSELRVGTVRNPLDWLVSYYRAIHPGAIHLPVVDVLKTLPVGSFTEFIRGYLLEMPGQVGRIFDAYPADVYLRVEDFPDNVVELFESLGVEPRQARLARNVIVKNKSRKPRPIWSPALFRAVAEVELETMERFEYELCDIHPRTPCLSTFAR